MGHYANTFLLAAEPIHETLPKTALSRHF